MVYRVFVEKRPEFAGEAKGLLSDITAFLGITNLAALRVVNRYDVENVDKKLF